ncbi:preprotein translocase SecA [Afipia sp. P52-10]|uniref:hypothetical protein n=1 Tax=Afipia sp. P52-10 TaxID=1429916 RepID=UPI0003DF0B83|nr:hypothetical protein [Afipia sp. P52-10]ETR76980.1 preprotein translocase SecA [Afipia sp. P52-10]
MDKQLAPAKVMQSLGEALMAEGAERQAKLDVVANELREELERTAVKIVSLVLLQPPTSLLGYVWGQVFLGLFPKKGGKPSKKAAAKSRDFGFYQFVLEYLHAVWSANAGPFQSGALDEAKAHELLAAFDEFRTQTMQYCLVSGTSDRAVNLGPEFRELGMQATTTWVNIRGHRHQVLEREFFSFAFAPHDEALKAAYGVGADEIADGVQRIADAFRTGHAQAAELMHGNWQAVLKRMAEKSISMEAAIQEFRAVDPQFAEAMGNAMEDLFYGGICKVSKHSKLPPVLLGDMSYVPGNETSFFEAGPFAGTPLRTLPARIKPLVKLDDHYYATDGQFVRDSAYRAIQWGLIRRNAAYRELWNKKQKELTEAAFSTILDAQLSGATLLSEVYFKDASGQWAETDTVGWLGDNLFIVEAKAGVMAMHSPETDFEKHFRAVQDLVVKAYRQCRRFVEYLASAPEVPLYQLVDGRHTEVVRLRLANFRNLFPIGLTIEAFTPFSVMCKRLPEVQPLLGKHPFISMSADDLFVLKRFLPTSGALFHYLSVRQAVAGIPDAMMFDEQDHLGAYIARNRFDHDMREQLLKADFLSWDGFSDKIEQHFGSVDWESKPAPQQHFPPELAKVLAVLDNFRPSGWLKCDSQIRDLSSSSRENLAALIRKLSPTLAQHPARSFVFGGDWPLQVFLHRAAYTLPDDEVAHRGEVACLITKKPSVSVLCLAYDAGGNIVSVALSEVSSPPAIRADYEALVREADSRRPNVTEFGGPQKATERLSKRARRRERGKQRKGD